MRFDSASASDLGGRYASGKIRVDARLPPRAASRVGVALSVSSIAEPCLVAPTVSNRLLSDAFESRREGNCRAIVLEAGGGIDTLARSTLPPFSSGSEDRAFLLAGEELLPEARACGVHDRVLSVLTVRDSCSIRLNLALTELKGGMELCFSFLFFFAPNRRIVTLGRP